METRVTEAFHPSEYIREEMDARDLSIGDVARLLPGDAAVNELTLRLYLTVGPKNSGLRIGALADGLSHVFNTSPELWRNLETAWLAKVEATE